MHTRYKDQQFAGWLLLVRETCRWQASSGRLLSEPGGAGFSALGSNWLRWVAKQASREMHDLLS